MYSNKQETQTSRPRITAVTVSTIRHQNRTNLTLPGDSFQEVAMMKPEFCVVSRNKKKITKKELGEQRTEMWKSLAFTLGEGQSATVHPH